MHQMYQEAYEPETEIYTGYELEQISAIIYATFWRKLQ